MAACPPSLYTPLQYYDFYRRPATISFTIVSRADLSALVADRSRFNRKLSHSSTVKRQQET